MSESHHLKLVYGTLGIYRPLNILWNQAEWLNECASVCLCMVWGGGCNVSQVLISAISVTLVLNLQTASVPGCHPGSGQRINLKLWKLQKYMYIRLENCHFLPCVCFTHFQVSIWKQHKYGIVSLVEQIRILHTPTVYSICICYLSKINGGDFRLHFMKL